MSHEKRIPNDPLALARLLGEIDEDGQEAVFIMVAKKIKSKQHPVEKYRTIITNSKTKKVKSNKNSTRFFKLL